MVLHLKEKIVEGLVIQNCCKVEAIFYSPCEKNTYII